MSSVATGDLESAYEERIRKSLQVQLFEVLRIPIIEPSEGFNRSFTNLRAEFGSSFSFNELECDFWAHSYQYDSPLRKLVNHEHLPTVTMNLSPDVAKIPFTKSEKAVSKPLSPEKFTGEILKFPTNSYVLGINNLIFLFHMHLS